MSVRAGAVSIGVAFLVACSGGGNGTPSKESIASCFEEAGYDVTTDSDEFVLGIIVGGEKPIEEGVQAESDDNTIVVLLGESEDEAKEIESAAKGTVDEEGVERRGEAVLVFGNPPTRGDNKAADDCV